jgi:hypothetical protein
VAKKGAVRVTVLGTADMRAIQKAKADILALEKAAKPAEKGLSGAMAKMGRGVRGFMTELRRLAPGMLMAGAVVGAMGYKFVRAGEEMATSDARIKNINQTMGLFGKEADNVSARLIKLAETQARATGVDTNTIKMTQAKLLTFKELAKTADEVGGMFDRANEAALDLAAAGFGEATSNAAQLGKALNDPIKGITALTRSGVTFTEQEKKKIKALVESGKMLEAQETLMRAIETQVGGTAKATANATDKIKVVWEQTAATIGQELLPEVEKLSDSLASLDFPDMIDDVRRFSDGVKVLREYWTGLQKFSSGGPIILGVAKAWEKYGEITEDVGHKSDDARTKAYELAAASGIYARRAKDASGAAKGFSGSAQTLTGDLEDNADATDDTAYEYDKLTRAMDGTMVKSDELSGRMRTITEASLDSREAALRLKDAENDLTEAMKNGSPDEIAKAQINYERAKLRSADATADLTQAERDLGLASDELAQKTDYLN